MAATMAMQMRFRTSSQYEVAKSGTQSKAATKRASRFREKAVSKMAMSSA